MTQPIGFKTAGEHVVLDGVNEQLMQFVAVLDRIHQQLFASQLTITTALNASPCARMVHYEGKAVDLAIEELDLASQLVWLNVLHYTATRMPVTICDERNNPGNPHIHLEWHGA